MKKADRNLNIRINGELHQMAKQKAKTDNRTLSNYIINLIIRDLEKEEKK